MKSSHWTGRRVALASIISMALAVQAPAPARAEPPASLPKKLSVTDALQRAFEMSPVLRIREAEVGQARGRLAGAEVLIPSNPELEGDLGYREGGGSRTFDWGVGLSQELEIFGQRGDRIDVAESGIQEALSQYLRAKRLLAARVQLAFADAVQAREIVGIEQTNVELASDLLQVAEKRFGAGDTTRLDVNLANAELGHAERGLHLARAEYLVTRAILAETIGLEPSARPEPSGDFGLPQEELPTLATLLKNAAGQRADLAAVQRSVQTAKARIALARSEAVPNITLRGFFEREADTENIAGGGLSLPIPIFDRNQGEIAEATAATSRAEAEVHVLQLQVEQEVISTHARFEAARDSAETLQHRVMGTLKENLDLLGHSFKAGKVGFTDVIVIRRALLESRAEYVDAVASAQKAHIELLLAAGRAPRIAEQLIEENSQ